MTMKLIGTTSSTSTSMVFSSIPQTFTDLMLVVSTRGAGLNNVFDTALRFNNDATSGRYATRALFATSNGITTQSFGDTTRTFAIQSVGGADAADTFGSANIYIPNYTSATAKSVVSEAVAPNNNASSQRIQIAKGLYNDTAAITQITILNAAINFNGSSIAYLYGITKGSGGATVS